MSLEFINSLTPNEAFILGTTCMGITKSNMVGTGTCLDTKIYKQEAIDWETEEFSTGIFVDEFKTGIPIIHPITYQTFLIAVLEYCGVNYTKIKPYIKDVATLTKCEAGVEFQLDNSDTIYRLMAYDQQMYKYNGQLYIKYATGLSCSLQVEKNSAIRNYIITTNGIKYGKENGFDIITCTAARLKHHIPKDITFIRFGGIEITEVGRIVFFLDGGSRRGIYQHTNGSLQEISTSVIKFTNKGANNTNGIILGLNPHNFTTEDLARISYLPLTINLGNNVHIPLTELFYTPTILTNVSDKQIYLVTNPKDSSWYCYIVRWSYNYVAGICNNGTMF